MSVGEVVVGKVGGIYRDFVQCSGCSNPLQVDIGTDGNGRLVESLEPCRTCSKMRWGRYGQPVLVVERIGAKTVQLAPDVRVLLDPLALKVLASLIRSGLSSKDAGAEMGCDPDVATKLRNAMNDERARHGIGPIRCRCGRPAGHNGRCSCATT